MTSVLRPMANTLPWYLNYHKRVVQPQASSGPKVLCSVRSSGVGRRSYCIADGGAVAGEAQIKCRCSSLSFLTKIIRPAVG